MASNIKNRAPANTGVRAGAGTGQNGNAAGKASPAPARAPAAQNSRWGNGPPSTTTSGASTPKSAQGQGQKAAKPAPQQQNQQQQQQQQQQSPAAAAAAVTKPVAPTPQSAAANAPSSEEIQKRMKERMMFLLVTLVGNPVTVSVKGGAKFFGIFSAANTEGGDLGVALASAQQVVNGKGSDARLGELKRMLIINSKDLESIEAAEIRVHDQAKEMREAREKEAFRTDTEISKAFDPNATGRALQKWSDDPDLPDIGASAAWAAPANGVSGGLESSKNKPWDQFAINEARFGVKSDYQETLYTTSLDKSGKDFRDREKEADRLAREIMAQSSSNIHVNEERGHVDDSGANEEDKYGAVVRNPNAYLPPAFRSKQSSGTVPTAQAGKTATPPANKGKPSATNEVSSTPAVTVEASSPAPNQDTSAAKKVESDNPLMGDFRQFVSSERERLEKKKMALAKKEKDSRLADLKAWGGSFTLKTPVPADVVGQDKPAGREASPTPSAGGVSTLSKAEAGKSSRSAHKDGSNAPSPSGGADLAAAELADTKAMLQKMTIPKIPPFNPDKSKARQKADAPNTTVPQTEGATALSASTSAFKLSAKASSFKPFNPNAAAFTPGGAAAAAPKVVTAALSPIPAAATPGVGTSTATSPVPATATPTNPFYGNQPLKKPSGGPGSLHVREDFNPFKVSKVPDAKSIGPMWAFNGKPYRQHFVLAGPPMNDGSGMYMAAHPGMHPGGQTPHQMHAAQVPMSGPAGGANQAYGMGYQPYGPGYQFQPGQQGMGRQPGMPMSQPMQMGPGSIQGGPPMPYGGMPQQYMGQMPFSPGMHAGPPPQNMYSPHMGAMPPSGQQQHFMPMPPGQAGQRPPPHLQHQAGPKGQHQQGPMYYQHNQPPPPHQQTHHPHQPQQPHQQPPSTQQKQAQPPTSAPQQPEEQKQGTTA